MSLTDKSIPTSLAGMLGQSALSDEEIAMLREQAWLEQGLLIVHPWDQKLTPDEAQIIGQIAERLYGGTWS